MRIKVFGFQEHTAGRQAVYNRKLNTENLRPVHFLSFASSDSTSAISLLIWSL
jgi:hypothetical protein